MVETDKVGSIEFKWGKKRGFGGKKKDVRFYESFTYDGVEYTLYDSVYLYKASETEPYIGKLIKIWENADKTKKVKVLWFFRPCEISNYLGDEKTAENELFLASGEGVGLANINPLETIAGKCDVVCISKDSRNPQPSDEELKRADFIFYRMFDVGQLTILDKIDEKIAGIDVKFLFKSADSQKSTNVPKLNSDKKEVGGNAVANDDTLILPEKNTSGECKTVKTEGNSIDTPAPDNVDSEVLLDKQKALLGEKPSSHLGEKSAEMAETIQLQDTSSDKTALKSKVKENADLKGSLVKQKCSLGETPASSMGVQFNDRQENISGDKGSLRSKDQEIADLVKQKSSLGEKSASNLGLESGEMAKNNRKENVSSDKFTLSPKDDSVRSESKVIVKEVQVEERIKVTKDSGELDERPSKKVKLDGSVRASDDKNKKSGQKLSHDSNGIDAKAIARTATASEDKSKPKLAKDPHGTDNGPSRKSKADEKLKKLANGKFPEASFRRASNGGGKTDNQMKEVTRKPEADKSKWFKKRPWEERMQTAHEHGTLVLLQNLEPSYTSAEVEDIVWHAFEENCTAKMIQRTAFSSPHSGRALVIFKTKEAAEKAVTKLNESCLLLLNGRPLLGSFATPCFPAKQSTFFGHLVIDKLRLQMQREMKEAVSTSHCSQPNTLEYDMAMQWCLLQERSDLTWKKLHEQQGEELRKLYATLKSK